MDFVNGRADEIEDLVRKHPKAAMQCSTLLILFRALTKEILDLLAAPRATDELGRKRFQKQLTELGDKWRQAAIDLVTCLFANGASL
jgi:hypothetical protein